MVLLLTPERRWGSPGLGPPCHTPLMSEKIPTVLQCPPQRASVPCPLPHFPNYIPHDINFNARHRGKRVGQRMWSRKSVHVYTYWILPSKRGFPAAQARHTQELSALGLPVLTTRVMSAPTLYVCCMKQVNSGKVLRIVPDHSRHLINFGSYFHGCHVSILRLWKALQ